MTKQQFLDKYRHELYGMVLDAAMGHHGSELSVRLRFAAQRIDQRLCEIFELLTAQVLIREPEPKATGATNGNSARASAPAQQRPAGGRPGA